MALCEGIAAGASGSPRSGVFRPIVPIKEGVARTATTSTPHPSKPRIAPLHLASMSYLDPSEIAFIVASYRDLIIGNSCTFAVGALIIYEVLILFGREVEVYWKRRITGASILFFLSKYLSFSKMILTWALYLPIFTDIRLVVLLFKINLRSISGAHSCETTQRVYVAIQMAQYLPWAVFSALRVYALSRSQIWTTLILALSLAPVGVNMSTYILNTIGGVNEPGYGCEETFLIPISSSESARGTIISRGCLILADVSVIGITMWSNRLVNFNGDNMLSHVIRSRSLQSLLVRDGTIYFIALLSLNTLHLAFSLQDMFNNGYASYFVLFTEPCTAVLVNRFLLHLQEAGSHTLRVETENSVHSQSFAFTS
ncbi:hypothetical protein C8Q80DRAFT_1358063, partial [Daedaleopsis nitida]